MTGFRWLMDQFFQLPRWERLGNIVMIAFVFLTVVLFSVWPVGKITAEEKTGLQQMQLALDKKQENAREQKRLEKEKRLAKAQAVLKADSAFFIADINKASYEDLTRCGLSKYVARNIVRYVEKGGRIETIEDARKLYGMTPEMLGNLLAHTQLDSFVAKKERKRYAREEIVVDLNTADSLQLVSVKGIGGKTAQRILKFRKQIGSFHSTEQLNEVWGIKPESLEQIKKQVSVNTFEPFIHINSISEKELSQHSYFRKDQLYKAVIAYRQMHGPYRNAGDLKKCKLVTDEVLERILPYIVFD